MSKRRSTRSCRSSLKFNWPAQSGPKPLFRPKTRQTQREMPALQRGARSNYLDCSPTNSSDTKSPLQLTCKKHCWTRSQKRRRTLSERFLTALQQPSSSPIAPLSLCAKPRPSHDFKARTVMVMSALQNPLQTRLNHSRSNRALGVPRKFDSRRNHARFKKCWGRFMAGEINLLAKERFIRSITTSSQNSSGQARLKCKRHCALITGAVASMIKACANH